MGAHSYQRFTCLSWHIGPLAEIMDDRARAVRRSC
jgi:hypothetical protein